MSSEQPKLNNSEDNNPTTGESELRHKKPMLQQQLDQPLNLLLKNLMTRAQAATSISDNY